MKKLIISAALLLGLGLSATSYGQKEGEWRIRLRGTAVVPSASGNLSVGGAATPGTVGITSSFIPEVDFTYFFVNRVSANLILGTTHNAVTAKNTALGNVALGKVWLLPPTLTFLYHQPLDKGHILPYIGAGVNYTIFYSKSLKTANPAVTDVTYQNHFGFATQIGSDFDISKKWFINVDIKNILLKTNNTVTTSVPLTINSNTKINPWLFSLGIGVKL